MFMCHILMIFSYANVIRSPHSIPYVEYFCNKFIQLMIHLSNFLYVVSMLFIKIKLDINEEMTNY